MDHSKMSLLSLKITQNTREMAISWVPILFLVTISSRKQISINRFHRWSAFWHLFKKTPIMAIYIAIYKCRSAVKTVIEMWFLLEMTAKTKSEQKYLFPLYFEWFWGSKVIFGVTPSIWSSELVFMFFLIRGAWRMGAACNLIENPTLCIYAPPTCPPPCDLLWHLWCPPPLGGLRNIWMVP